MTELEVLPDDLVGVDQEKSQGFPPNMEVLLRIHLTLMINNCIGEKSFFKLKLFKDEHRSTVRQNRVGRLTMFSTECYFMGRINLNKILSECCQDEQTVH